MEKKLINGKTLSYYLRHPGALRTVERTEIKALLNEYPYSSHLHLLAAIKDQLEFGMVSQDLLEKAAVYIADRRRLGEWMNKLQSLRKDDSFLFPESDPKEETTDESEGLDENELTEEDEMLKEVLDSIEEESLETKEAGVEHRSDPESTPLDDQDDPAETESDTASIQTHISEITLSGAMLQQVLSQASWQKEVQSIFIRQQKQPSTDQITEKAPVEPAAKTPVRLDLDTLIQAATSIDEYVSQARDLYAEESAMAPENMGEERNQIERRLDIILEGTAIQEFLFDIKNLTAFPDTQKEESHFAISDIILTASAISAYVSSSPSLTGNSRIENEIIYDLSSEDTLTVEPSQEIADKIDETPEGEEQAVFYDQLKEGISSSHSSDDQFEESNIEESDIEDDDQEKDILEGDALRRALEAEEKWRQRIGVLLQKQPELTKSDKQEWEYSIDMSGRSDDPDASRIEYSSPSDPDKNKPDQALDSSDEQMDGASPPHAVPENREKDNEAGEQVPESVDELIQSELQADAMDDSMDQPLQDQVHINDVKPDDHAVEPSSEPSEDSMVNDQDQSEQEDGPSTSPESQETQPDPGRGDYGERESFKESVFTLDEGGLKPISTDGDPESPFLQWLHSLTDSHTQGYKDWEKESKDKESQQAQSRDQSVEESESEKKKRKKKKKKTLKMESLRADEALVSEALAELLANQGHTKRAIKMYQKLRLIIPEKSVFFAQKIEELEQKK